MKPRILVVPLVVLLTATGLRAAPAKPAKPGPPLPDGVAAVVKGDVVTMDAFRAALVRRFSGIPEGRKVLESYATDMVVEAERKRRGIEVTDAEIDAYLKKIAVRVLKASSGSKTLDDVIKEKEVTKAEFRKITRDFLVRQRMAAQDLDQPGEVSTANLRMWLDDLKKKAGVVVGTKDLPEGVYAKVGDHEIRAGEYGRALLQNLPSSRLESVLWDIAISMVVNQRMKKAGVTITEKDKDEAVQELADAFHADPRFHRTKITFAQAIQTVRHMTIPELKEDPIFLAQVGLSKMLRASVTEDQVKAYWKKHQDRYGEVREFIHLLIRGEDHSSALGGGHLRSLKAARTKIDAILARYHDGEAFEDLVKKESEARSKTVRPQDPIDVTRETPMPKALKDLVFSSPVGEVVGPVLTAYGYHLVKVLSVTPAPTFEQVQARVLRDLIREERSHELLEIRQDPDIRLRYGGK